MELITICAWCKTETNRQNVEYSTCGVTHGICVYCQQKYFSGIFSAPLDQGTTHSTQEMESDLTGECG